MRADGSLLPPLDLPRGVTDEPLDRLAPIRFGREVCGDLAAAERREWWLANGRGGYAGGTVAPQPDPALSRAAGRAGRPAARPGAGVRQGRCRAASSASERYPLFTNRWASGAVSPQAICPLDSFHLDGTDPVWRFAIGACRIEQRIWLEPGANTIYIAWRLLAMPAGAAPRLIRRAPRQRPRPSRRHLEARLRAGNFRRWRRRHDDRVGSLRVAYRGCRAEPITPQRDWFENFDLPVERERGLSDRDHHLCIGRARAAAGDQHMARDRRKPRSRRLCGHSGCARAAPGARPARDRAGGCRRSAVWHRARLGHAAGPGERSLRHRPSRAGDGRRTVGHRRLSLVRRLGARHDDRAARAPPGDRPVRRCPQDPRHLRALRRSRHAAECLPRRRRRARIQHGRCGAVVRRGVARLCRGHRRRCGARPGLSGAGRDRRAALRAARATASPSTRPTACCAPARRGCSSPGWTRRSAIGW